MVCSGLQLRSLLLLTLLACPMPSGSQTASRREQLNLKLSRAVLKNDYAAVKALLARGADPNTLVNCPDRPTNINSPIILKQGVSDAVADRSDSYQPVLILGNFNGMRVLELAAWGGYLAVAKLLLDKGADVNARSDFGSSALIQAAEISHPDGVIRSVMIRLLLSRGADVHTRQASGISVLMASAGAKDIDLVKLLLDRGADIDARNEEGMTPLMAAMLTFDRDMARLLIERGADVNARTHSDITVLRIADVRCRDLVPLLQKAGAKE